MAIEIIKNKIKKEELFKFLRKDFIELVKAVVDTEKEIMAIGGELHSDEEILLVEEEGTKREYAWGINLFPKRPEDEWIEFDSMINLKPMWGNRSRGVENAEIREKIRTIVKKLIIE